LLQAQPFEAGAGMKFLPGAAFRIWWMMPGSVATMMVSEGEVTAHFRMAEVDPIWSA
jgi:hypothetical protein